jgi:hypothetical protein
VHQRQPAQKSDARVRLDEPHLLVRFSLFAEQLFDPIDPCRQLIEQFEKLRPLKALRRGKCGFEQSAARPLRLQFAFRQPGTVCNRQQAFSHGARLR